MNEHKDYLLGPWEARPDVIGVTEIVDSDNTPLAACYRYASEVSPATGQLMSIGLPTEKIAQLMAEAPALKAENARLWQQNAELRKACERLMKNFLTHVPEIDSYQCNHCFVISRQTASEFPHKDGCAILQARAAIARARREEAQP